MNNDTAKAAPEIVNGVEVPFLAELPGYEQNETFAKNRTIFTITKLEYQNDETAAEAHSKFGARWLLNVTTTDGEPSILTFKANPGRDEEMKKLDEYLDKVGPLSRCRVNKRTTDDGNPVYYINRVPTKQA